MLIFTNLCMSLLIISSPSLVSVWVGIEVISMTIPPILMAHDNSMISKINSWKYFVIQCYSSSIFFLCLLCSSFSSSDYMYSNVLWMIIFMSMLVKMGIVPFHGWIYQISSNITWDQFLIISSIQKIGPMIIISESYGAMLNNLSIELLISSIITSISVTMLTFFSIRFFMITSSSINSMWMITASQVSKTSFLFFMFFYLSHLWIFFKILKLHNFNFINSIFFSWKEKYPVELSKILLLLSIIGMPPLTGFFMKLSIIEQLLFKGHLFITLVLMMSSSLIMLMYLKLIMVNMNSIRSCFNQSSYINFVFPPLITVILSGPVLYLM